MSNVVLVVGLLGAGEDVKGDGRFRLIRSVPRDDLKEVTGLTMSPGGKFLYAAARQSACVFIFARGQETGKLEHEQTIASRDLLAGTTSLTLSDCPIRGTIGV
jgi:hypothetical protein